jgi:hypothetical protein
MDWRDEQKITEEHGLRKCSMGRCCNAQTVDELAKQLKSDNNTIEYRTEALTKAMEQIERLKKNLAEAEWFIERWEDTVIELCHACEDTSYKDYAQDYKEYKESK